MILEELVNVESELDSLLPNFGASERDFSVSDQLKTNKYLKTYFRDPDQYKTNTSREQVFLQALSLEQDIHTLNEDLQAVNRQMTD